MKRMSRVALGYGADWQMVRNAHINEHPWCVACAEQGVQTPGRRSTTSSRCAPIQSCGSSPAIFAACACLAIAAGRRWIRASVDDPRGAVAFLGGGVAETPPATTNSCQVCDLFEAVQTERSRVQARGAARTGESGGRKHRRGARSAQAPLLPPGMIRNRPLWNRKSSTAWRRAFAASSCRVGAMPIRYLAL